MSGNSNSGRRPRKTTSIDAPNIPAVMPAGLSEAQKAAWYELAPAAEQLGTLRAADAPAFRVLVNLWALFHSPDITRPTDVARMAAELGRYLTMFKLQPSAQGRGISRGASDSPMIPATAKPDVRDFAKRARLRLELARARVQ